MKLNTATFGALVVDVIEFSTIYGYTPGRFGGCFAEFIDNIHAEIKSPTICPTFSERNEELAKITIRSQKESQLERVLQDSGSFVRLLSTGILIESKAPFLLRMKLEEMLKQEIFRGQVRIFSDQIELASLYSTFVNMRHRSTLPIDIFITEDFTEVAQWALDRLGRIQLTDA